jgi:hypothetical protein
MIGDKGEAQPPSPEGYDGPRGAGQKALLITKARSRENTKLRHIFVFVIMFFKNYK